MCLAGLRRALWMQTVGTTLLAVKLCSIVRVRMPAYDSHSAQGLPYLAAVWDDGREQEHRQGRIEIGSASLTAAEAANDLQL